MLIVLALSHIHCLPALVYIRVNLVVERRGINNLAGEEYYVEYVHGYLRLNLTLDVTVTLCHKEPGACNYSP
jgi:hypothetical protein